MALDRGAMHGCVAQNPAKDSRPHGTAASQATPGYAFTMTANIWECSCWTAQLERLPSRLLAGELTHSWQKATHAVSSDTHQFPART